jgi:hypothetical protein
MRAAIYPEAEHAIRSADGEHPPVVALLRPGTRVATNSGMRRMKRHVIRFPARRAHNPSALRGAAADPGRERALLRLAQSAGLLVIVAVPIVATALSKGLGLPALLNWWGAGFLGAWCVILVATLRYAAAATRLHAARMHPVSRF